MLSSSPPACLCFLFHKGCTFLVPGFSPFGSRTYPYAYLHTISRTISLILLFGISNTFDPPPSYISLTLSSYPLIDVYTDFPYFLCT
ncbi:hypothetical protein BDQ12DRAFT_686940 [Crucibulum laeve]|uniref:Uncharacterized protein n=1 Tax=Crucibulum laeve TaxID=68775 RepID=A0A5C3LU52_9AGAR|nr:hypothetical protein BDQ12DRAFT_686940 [Crucibulum laeve]